MHINKNIKNMDHLQSEKIVKTLWHYEDHLYILKKEGDQVWTPETLHIEDFVFESQVHLLLQTVFC